MRKGDDLTNKKFGRLTVVKREPDERKNSYWLCKCICGNEKIIGRPHLISGHTKSCGCLHKEMITKHGKYQEPLYKVWSGMWSRCTYQNHKQYQDYGGRGINVCNRWRDFKNFLSDMGNRPSPNHTIERINNNKGYNPSNCKWATRTEQSRNTRLRKNNKTGYEGVTWDKRREKYHVYIRFGGKRMHLGYYKFLKEAAEIRIKAEEKYWKSS